MALQHGMGRDHLALVEDADLVRQRLHLGRAPARAVRHAVEIAAHRDHAVAGHAPVQPKHGLERACRQRLEAGPLVRGMFAHDAAGRGVGAPVGHLVQPLPELAVEAVRAADAAGQEKVPAHVAERALDLALALGPMRAARPGLEAVVPGARRQRGVVDHACRVLAADRGAHAVVEDFAWDAAQVLERRGVAAQHGLQALMGAAGMDRRTLCDWVHRCDAGGLAGLGDRHGGGAPSRLSPEQEAEVADWIRTGPAVEKDGVVRWRCVDIQVRPDAERQSEIAREWGVALHERSVAKLLHRLRFARVSTRPRHPKADPAAQASFGPGSQPL